MPIVALQARLSSRDLAILRDARRRLGAAQPDFATAVAALAAAAQAAIIGGRVFVIGSGPIAAGSTGGAGPIIGSQISGVGIVEIVQASARTIELVRVHRDLTIER